MWRSFPKRTTSFGIFPCMEKIYLVLAKQTAPLPCQVVTTSSSGNKASDNAYGRSSVDSTLVKIGLQDGNTVSLPTRLRPLGLFPHFTCSLYIRQQVASPNFRHRP